MATGDSWSISAVEELEEEAGWRALAERAARSGAGHVAWPREQAERALGPLADALALDDEEEHPGGLWAAVAADPELQVVLALLVQTRRARREGLVAPPPPGDFLARVRRPLEATQPKDPAREPRDLGERLTGAVDRLRSWIPAFPNLAPGGGLAPSFALPRLAGEAAAGSGRLANERVLSATGWRLHLVAWPEDAAAAEGPWAVEVGLSNPIQADAPVMNAEVQVLTDTDGAEQVREGRTDADGSVVFRGLPSTALAALQVRVPAEDEPAAGVRA